MCYTKSVQNASKTNFIQPTKTECQRWEHYKSRKEYFEKNSEKGYVVMLERKIISFHLFFFNYLYILSILKSLKVFLSFLFHCSMFVQWVYFCLFGLLVTVNLIKVKHINQPSAMISGVEIMTFHAPLPLVTLNSSVTLPSPNKEWNLTSL